MEFIISGKIMNYPASSCVVSTAVIPPMNRGRPHGGKESRNHIALYISGYPLPVGTSFAGITNVASHGVLIPKIK